MARNPVILFVVAPIFLFLIRQRFSTKGAKPVERHSVWWMNLAIAGMVTGLVWAFRMEKLPYHPTDLDDGVGQPWGMAVLRPASV